jgi:DNA polymerase-1
MKGRKRPVRIYDYYETIEKPIAQIFYQMSNRGITVDLKYLNTLRTQLEAQKFPIEQDIYNQLGHINLNSPKQLIGALNEKGIYPTLKGKPSTDKRAIERFRSNRIVDNLLSFSQIETLLTSFVYPYLERGQNCVHPFFNQCGTRTGRLSCSNPNLLQIPKHSDNGKLVRKMFIPRHGMQLGDCDFGQIEPRVLAHLSKDPNMLRMFNDGIDFHTFTAENLGIDRQRAKILNLSVGYRATYKSVSQQLKCSDSEAQNEIDKWWSLFPTLRRWQEGLIYDSTRSGFCTTLMGRRIKVDRLSDGNTWRKEGAERQLINNITQGSAAEIMKLAMIKISNDLGRGAFQATTKFGLLVQVYDELLFEADQRDIRLCTEEVAKHMQNAIKLDVPLVVDAKTGPNWGEVS